MIRIALLTLFVSTSLLLVAMITFVAVLWCHLSHLRRDFGPTLFGLWSTHGVHVGDFVFLGIDLFLGALLTAVLVAGFNDSR